MKSPNMMAVLLKEQNFETSRAVWESLNQAQQQYQDRFWVRIGDILSRKVGGGWRVEPGDKATSENWYDLSLIPPHTGATYSCVRIQQTKKDEDWRLQWGVGMGTASGWDPSLPGRGAAAQLIDELKGFLRQRNFQPSRGKRSWYIAKRYREERLGDWSVVRAIAENDEIERRIATDLLELLDRTRTKIVALNRALP
jgi:hypothetical protein